MKKILVVLAVLLLMVSVAACNGGTPEPAPPQDAAPPEAAAQPPVEAPAAQELNLAIFEGGFGAAFWHEVIRMFEADNPGVTVNMQISPMIGDIIRPQIVAGQVPDFMNLSANDATGLIQSMINDRALMDLTDVFNGPQYDNPAPLRNRIIPGFLESNICAPYGDGRIFMAPGNAGPMGMVYNITLFEQHGWQLPVTWDDFFALGELARAEGIYLFTYQGIHPGYMESIIFPAIASHIGAAEFDRITSYDPGIWTDPRVITVLEKIERIYTEGFLMPGTVALNHTQAQTEHMQNRALFIPNGTWMEEEMAEVPRAAGFRFGLTPPPVMNAGDPRYVMSFFEQFSIPANAPNPELAIRFLRFLYTDAVVAAYARLNGGAIMATVGALDLVRPYITDGLYGMWGVYNLPGVYSLMVGFEAVPEGSIVTPSDEIFNPVPEVLSGTMTARQWAENIDRAYREIAAGR